MSDIDTMTPDELREALRNAEREPEKEGNIRTVNVDGVDVTVDMAVVRGFGSLMLMSQIYDEGESVESRTVALVKFCKLVLGDSMPAILDHLGGERATTEAVIEFVGSVMTELKLKN